MQGDREDDRQGVDRDGLDEIEFPWPAGFVFYQSGGSPPRAPLPVMPDGFQIVGQLRQRARSPCSPPCRDSRNARSGEAEFARDCGPNSEYCSGEWLPVTTSIPTPPQSLNSARNACSSGLEKL